MVAASTSVGQSRCYLRPVRDLRSICVFAGSTPVVDDRYAAAAASVGHLLAHAGIRLVYGGAAVGLMGITADAALGSGGVVVGVIPRGLFSREVPHPGLTELVEVQSMHERKRAMFDLSDAFVALPGGLGTFEELFEVVSWAHLGIHDKPIATFDVDDFWQPMRTLLERTVSIGFIRASRLGLIANVSNTEDLLPVLRAYDFAAGPGISGVGL
jgi:uncharacterized protein (TIGR00730 family)